MCVFVCLYVHLSIIILSHVREHVLHCIWHCQSLQIVNSRIVFWFKMGDVAFPYTIHFIHFLQEFSNRDTPIFKNKKRFFASKANVTHTLYFFLLCLLVALSLVNSATLSLMMVVVIVIVADSLINIDQRKHWILNTILFLLLSLSLVLCLIIHVSLITVCECMRVLSESYYYSWV